MPSAFSEAGSLYASSREHLSDTLKWLDLTLLANVLKYDGQTSDPSQNMSPVEIIPNYRRLTNE